MAPRFAMNSHRAGSTVLLAGGVFLVFAGMSSALGFSTAGIVASLAAIAGLLYAGGVWFGTAPQIDPSIVVFTPDLKVAGGVLDGRRVRDVFADDMRHDVEAACREAIGGRPSRFTAGHGSARRNFEAAPVLGAGGVVIYGVLLSGVLAERTITTPSATTISENMCATVNGPAMRTFTRTNSSANRNAPASTK